MDQIEQKIVLPPGAGPLSKYARYYSPDGRGNIWASFEPEMDTEFIQQVKVECQRIQKEGAFIGKQLPFPCSQGDGGVRFVGAGERLWITNYNELPTASGGGCGYITFVYQVKTSRFTNLACNGPY